MDAKPSETDKGKEPKMVSAGKKCALLMGFGAFAVVLGAIALVFWPALFFSQLKKMMILTNVSTSFSVWRETPVPMYLRCYMFNISNVDEILAGRNVKPKVEQMGPYVFQERHSKENITWHNENNTVAFYNERWWYFQPDMSNGSLSDQVTSINPVIATVAYLLRDEALWMRIAVNLFMRTVHEHMFITANASSWLFDGIKDPVLNIAQQFPNISLNIPYDRFGWFYSRNGSMEYDGAFLMNTGASDFSQLGNVEMWRHSNRTMYRDQCGEVRGSTGELWAPELGQPEVAIFAPDICTYLILNKNKDVIIDGIEGVEYAANDSVFDNGYRYPKMACYCDEVRDADCLPSGALNVSACRYGAPAFVSLPHMLHSDPYYPNKIDGMAPTDDHNFRLALEMFTGMPLAASAQLQVNLLVRHVSGISIANRLPDPDTLVPMFWFLQEVRVTPEYARLAKFALNLRYGVPYGLYALTLIGLALLVAGIVVLMRRLLQPTDEPILDEFSRDERDERAQLEGAAADGPSSDLP